MTRPAPWVRRSRTAWGERGLVLPSWLVAVSAALVAAALVGFAVTGDRDPDVVASDPESSTTAETGDGDTGADSADDPGDDASQDGVGGAGDEPPDDEQTEQADQNRQDEDDEEADRNHRDRRTEAPVERRTSDVEVYNNSAVTGLASSSAATLQDAGWEVVATDNWYGDIPTSTVYYPDALSDQAELLAADLGVGRVMPAVEPMRFDRLTVILTAQP